MDITVCPGGLRGSVTPPASKSQAHRLIIAAALSDGVCRLKNMAMSEDIAATLGCMRTLDADASRDGSIIRGAALVDGHEVPVSEIMDCGESGSTLRFLIPVALALKGEGKFTGRGRLLERPQQPYIDLFREKGIVWRREGDVLTVSGRLEPGEYRLRGDVSSQFVTGLLYALPLLDGPSEIVLTTPLESRGYVDMTLDALARFGVEARFDGAHTLRVPGGQTYRHTDAELEGDYSQAAFFLAANALGGQVEILGLNPRSVQGDRVIVEQCRQLARPGRVELDVSQCPDLVPPLAAMAAVRAGTTHLTHAARLRMKESDRLSTVAAALRAMGAQVEEGPDSLTIHGRERLPGGGTVDCCNDHRIAMMAAVSAAFAQAPVKLLGAECVRKSYPEFWNHFIQLGGEVHGLILR